MCKKPGDTMNFRCLLLCACMSLAAPASAENIYKCKGKNGEVAFSNVPCDGKASAPVHSTYVPVKDDPPQVTTVADAAPRSTQTSRDPTPNATLPMPAQAPYEPSSSSSGYRNDHSRTVGYSNDLSERYRRSPTSNPADAPRTNSTGGYANDLSDSYNRKSH